MNRREQTSTEPSSLAVGTIMFAGVIMITIGAFHTLWGFTALLNNEVFISCRIVTCPNRRSRLGMVPRRRRVVAGWFLSHPAVGARLVESPGRLSAVTNFLSIPYHPIFGLIILTFSFGPSPCMARLLELGVTGWRIAYRRLKIRLFALSAFLTINRMHNGSGSQGARLKVNGPSALKHRLGCGV
jgi:hypothetical protein